MCSMHKNDEGEGGGARAPAQVSQTAQFSRVVIEGGM